MLNSLSIRNIVLVEKLDIEFFSGFTTLTGETGAGKSILLDSLALALGKRAEARYVRSGEKQGSVIAEFNIENNNKVKKILLEQGFTVEDRLILRRVITPDGKSRAFINDEPSGISLLKDIGEHLVEIHGQHEQGGLLNNSFHRQILDDFAGSKEQLEKTRDAFLNWQQAKNILLAKIAEAEKIKQEEEFLRHAVDELLTLNPEIGEEETLAEKRRILINSEKIAASLKSAIIEIQENKPVQEALRSAQRILFRNQQAGDLFKEAIDALDKAANETEEAVSVLEKLSENINPYNNSLENIEERLFAIREAARKYRKSPNELPSLLVDFSKKLKFIDGEENQLAKFSEEEKKSKKLYMETAEALSEKRSRAAKEMEKLVGAELPPLKLSSSSFKVKIEKLGEENFGLGGIDKVHFSVKTNAGGDFGPLSKIASGGELSRFMLALKVVLLESSQGATIVFDEIDAGIGGAVADAVGKRLAKLGDKQQVMVVTHQPQVAAYGENNFLVIKQVKNDKTTTIVKKLNKKEKKEELARMLAGENVTDEARAAAIALMDS